MSAGWTVAVLRLSSLGKPPTREYWDCAIPGYEDAEDAVRQACDPVGVLLITACEPLTDEVVRLLQLEAGQVRKL